MSTVPTQTANITLNRLDAGTRRPLSCDGSFEPVIGLDGLYADAGGSFVDGFQVGDYVIIVNESTVNMVLMSNDPSIALNGSSVIGPGERATVYFTEADGTYQWDIDLVVKKESAPLHEIVVGTGTGLGSSSYFIYDDTGALNVNLDRADENGGGVVIRSTSTNLSSGYAELTLAENYGQSSFASLKAGDGAGEAAGAPVYLQAGNADSNDAGSVNITAGNAANYGAGGWVNLNAGTTGSVNEDQTKNGGVGLYTKSGSIELLQDGSLNVNGTPGKEGDVLLSHGVGQAASWGRAPWQQLNTKNITDALYVLALDDGLTPTHIRMISAVDCIVQIPLDADVAIPVGATVLVGWTGAGQVTVTGADGVVVNSPDTYKIGRQHGKITLMKVGVNEWDIEGNLEPSIA